MRIPLSWIGEGEKGAQTKKTLVVAGSPALSNSGGFGHFGSEVGSMRAQGFQCFSLRLSTNCTQLAAPEA